MFGKGKFQGGEYTEIKISEGFISGFLSGKCMETGNFSVGKAHGGKTSGWEMSYQLRGLEAGNTYRWQWSDT